MRVHNLFDKCEMLHNQPTYSIRKVESKMPENYMHYSNVYDNPQVLQGTTFTTINQPMPQFQGEIGDSFQGMLISPFSYNTRENNLSKFYFIQDLDQCVPFIERDHGDLRKWRNLQEIKPVIKSMPVQSSSIVLIPVYPSCSLQSEVSLNCMSKDLISQSLCMCDMNNSINTMNTSAYNIDQNKIKIQMPPQSNNISSEKNEEECNVLEVNEDLDANDPFSKLSYEEFKQRNHKEFVRSELIESLGLSKEKMYFELLKPYKHKRIQSFDYKTQSHRYLYICNYGDCRKEFTKGWNILDHARMHENIKPYQCDGCDRSFTQKCNLTKHYRRHLIVRLRDRKRFFCEVCRKGFTERYNLKVFLTRYIIYLFQKLKIRINSR